jgi:hypothetical protein
MVRVLPQAYTGTQNVTVQIFTAMFKPVATKSFPNVPAGETVSMDLVDDWGQPLGNDVYYITVTVGTSKKTTTLVIAR